MALRGMEKLFLYGSLAVFYRQVFAGLQLRGLNDIIPVRIA